MLCHVGLHAPSAGAPPRSSAAPGRARPRCSSLIPRLVDVTAGAVLVDGVDVRNARTRRCCGSRIGYVPQRAYLFSGTIASTLRYGDPDATDEELWAALEVAQARDFVERLPDGLDAPVAQGGTNLSGGQRQRLAIARALVRRPRDLPVRRRVLRARSRDRRPAARRAARRSPAAAAVIVVAQRVSTILDADQIVVLDAGEIVGRGTHDELLRDSARRTPRSSRASSAVEDAA